ncbi:MAG: ThuA domain-containing protein, partial [Bryobacterales bacterium]|nr:ThuA domain-containing protein [Bryobacterales bacterium]
RGPAENLTVLATAWADPATGGSGEHEPVLMTIRYGKGRVFHTVLGHGVEAMQCAGFVTTFQRGTEWAATGKVTLKVPADFPSAAQVSMRR